MGAYSMRVKTVLALLLSLAGCGLFARPVPKLPESCPPRQDIGSKPGGCYDMRTGRYVDDDCCRAVGQRLR